MSRPRPPQERVIGGVSQPASLLVKESTPGVGGAPACHLRIHQSIWDSGAGDTGRHPFHWPNPSILYLSLFFKKHRRLYYDRLNGTREDEGWTAWMDFFLQGVRDTANQAARTATNIDKLFRTDKEKIEHFGRGAASAMLIYRHAQVNPLFSIKSAAREMKVSFLTASAAVARMIDAGILRESSGQRRDRLFLYSKYLDVLNQDL
jgi:hypothetical protein